MPEENDARGEQGPENRIRAARSADLASIQHLLNDAFSPSKAEGDLVRGLLENGRTIHHWVLEIEGNLQAYVCYSLAYRGVEAIGFHLAPVAVRTSCQRMGLGTAIIRGTLREPPMVGSSVFVLGNPLYYARFGFRRVPQPVCPFDSGNEHFMALRYDSQAEFQVGYEPEFQMFA